MSLCRLLLGFAMDDLAAFVSHNCFWILVLVAFFVYVKFITGGSKSGPEKTKRKLADNEKKIREEYRKREQRFEGGEFDMPCTICNARCRPLRGTRTQYDCAECDKQFEGPRHDF